MGYANEIINDNFFDWVSLLIKKPVSLKKDLLLDTSISFKKWRVKHQQIFITWQNYSILGYSWSNFYFYHTHVGNMHLNSSPFFLLKNSQNKIIKTSDSSFLPSGILHPENDIKLFQSFFFLRRSSFINFFVNNLIDTPNCFKKIKSLRRRNYELPILKLINFLTKSGKREQFQLFFFKALSSFYSTKQNLVNYKNVRPEKKDKILYDILNPETNFSFFKNFSYNWVNFYLILHNLFAYYNEKSAISVILDNTFRYDLNYKNVFYNDGKLINHDCYTKHFLLNKLTIALPIFTFFIYNVDKNVKKYSRGKSGKYSFVWKYISSYKRLYVTMKLIVKDIKFANGRKITDRIRNTLFTIFSEPKKSFIWKSKIFSYNYVFKNYRKTLMKTLKTNK